MRPRQSFIARPLEYDEALITSLSRYGEADCIVRLFTRRQGRMNAFFKRGLEPSRQGQGAIVPLGFAHIAHVAGSDQRMTRLYSIDPDPRCLLLASSLKLFAYSSYVAELIEKLLPEHEVAKPIFDLVQKTHEAFLGQGAQSNILRAFELKLLDYLGYLPEIPEPSHDYFYDPIACGFMREHKAPGFHISRSALKLALAMIETPFGAFADAKKSDLMMLGRIFHSRLKVLGLLPLKSMVFFKSLSQN